MNLDTPVAVTMARQVQCVPPRGAALERPLQQSHEGVVRDGARPSQLAFVVQAHEALDAEAFAPPADRLAADADPFGHRLDPSQRMVLGGPFLQVHHGQHAALGIRRPRMGAS